MEWRRTAGRHKPISDRKEKENSRSKTNLRVLPPRPLTHAQGSGAVAQVGWGSGEGAEPHSAAAHRQCRLAMRWPDSPNGTVAWRPHNLPPHPRTRAQGSGAVALVGRGAPGLLRRRGTDPDAVPRFRT
jgi:hypothetical protein